MLSQIFLGMSLIGAEWVLYCLILLSVLSVSVMIERFRFYRNSAKGLTEFRIAIRNQVGTGELKSALELAEARAKKSNGVDLETELVSALIEQKLKNKNTSSETFVELAQDAVLRPKVTWDQNLAVLATIGNIAPFIGLFGTVLGIIKAFHDLSQQAGGAAQSVTAGVSEALVATAVGLLVAIPASIAFNLFSRKVKAATMSAESFKGFLIGKLGDH